jgi:hypothetical protein
LDIFTIASVSANQRQCRLIFQFFPENIISTYAIDASNHLVICYRNPVEREKAAASGIPGADCLAPTSQITPPLPII